MSNNVHNVGYIQHGHSVQVWTHVGVKLHKLVTAQMLIYSSFVIFQLGEEFDETTPDGREVSAVVNLEDGKIVTVQKAKKEGQKSTKSVREMNGTDEMIYTMTIDGVDDLKCVQKFKRV